MISPSSFCVLALNALQKSMMLTPAWPSAGPTGGAGVAFPAGICSLICPTTFFMNLLFSGWCCVAPPRPPLRSAGVNPALLRASTLLHRLQLLDLEEVELDRRRPAEDGHHHLERVAVEVDLLDHALEV